MASAGRAQAEIYQDPTLTLGPALVESETFQTVGRLTPVAWAVDGFENLVICGLGLTSVWLPAAILLGYGLLFFNVAVWRFRLE